MSDRPKRKCENGDGTEKVVEDEEGAKGNEGIVPCPECGGEGWVYD